MRKGEGNMAWIGSGFWADYTFVDKRGKATNIRLQMQEDAYADAEADAVLVLGYLEDVIEATCTRYQLTERWDNDAWDYPAGQCSVAEKAIVTLRINNKPAKKANFAIPAPKIGIFEEAEGPTPDGEVFISDGEEVAEIADGGFVQGRRSNRKYPQTVG